MILHTPKLKTDLVGAIETVCYELYGLTDEEIAVVELLTSSPQRAIMLIGKSERGNRRCTH